MTVMHTQEPPGGHRQRAELWDCANHPRSGCWVGRGKGCLGVPIIFCEDSQNILKNPLGASELLPIKRNLLFQSKYGNSWEKQLEEYSSTEKGA